MRSAIVAAAFVAGAIAVPYQKRDIVTDVQMEYVTDVVTVTAGEELPTSTSTVEAVPTAHQAAHFGHHSWHPESSSEAASTPEVTTVIVVPSTSSSTSEYVAPTTSSVYVKPTTSSVYVKPTTSSVYIAPTTSSTSEWVAPVTTIIVVPSTSSTTSASKAPTTVPAVVIPVLSSSSSSAEADTTSESSSTPTSYEQIAVYHHNIHRANHSAPDIEWDSGLAQTAADIAASCVYAHNTDANGGGYGQNIAAGVEPANISAIITDLFYNGEVNWFTGYGDANPDMTEFEHWGHFSQIVWKASTHVGCATQYCPGGLGNVGSGVSPYFTVCNYQEVGNMGGEYGDNIGEPLGHPTADWSAGGIS